MKQLIKNIIPLLVIAFGMSSCLKEGVANVDPTKSGTNVVTLQYLSPDLTTINSGMQYFGGGALSLNPGHDADTISFNVAIGGPLLNKDLPVTIGIDQSKLLDNYASDSLPYELMPDSIFKIESTTGVIKAGEAVAPFKIIFFSSKFDGSKNYGLPIVITDASGQTISSNYGTLYLHTIGNPIAGSYAWDYSRWNSSSNAGSPTSGFTEGSTSFVPLTPTLAEVASGYVGIRYMISFEKDASGDLVNFEVEMNEDDVAAAGITIIDGPHIIKADPTTGEYIFQFKANNGSADRYLIDRFYK